MVSPFTLSVGTSLAGHFIFAGKIAGAVVALGGLFYHPTKKILAGVKKISNMTDSVDVILTNHLPHIQTALTESTQQMGELKSDVRNLDTTVSAMSERVSDTNKAVQVLSTSFIQHLENMSAEKSSKRSSKAR